MDSCVALTVHDYNFHAVRLEQGYILGSLQVATTLPSPADREKQTAKQESTVEVVQPPTHRGMVQRQDLRQTLTVQLGYWINSVENHYH